MSVRVFLESLTELAEAREFWRMRINVLESGRRAPSSLGPLPCV